MPLVKAVFRSIVREEVETEPISAKSNVDELSETVQTGGLVHVCANFTVQADRDEPMVMFPAVSLPAKYGEVPQDERVAFTVGNKGEPVIICPPAAREKLVRVLGIIQSIVMVPVALFAPEEKDVLVVFVLVA